ncbi:MAG: phosphotransferase [Dehalococcoidia bacterium]|nr:phosphotransferase [Dehalococcoidia bacterium]
MDDLGPFIGRGYIAEVFAYGEGKVVKLLFDEDGAEAAEREAHITTAAVEAGLPVPKISETLTVNGRPGIVMERVEGATMLRWGTTFPWRIYTGARMMARLHAEVHSKAGVDIPDLRDRLRPRIEESEVVEEDLKVMALERLESLPDGDRICHVDFHPDNLIMTKAGPVIIDWEFGAKGVPEADIARTVVLVQSGIPLVSGVRRVVIEWARKIFLSFYLKEYFRVTGMEWEDVTPWLLPMATHYLDSVFPEHLADQLAYTRQFV